MRRRRTLQSKIRTPEATARAVRKERGAGRKVVFTNGCFDIVHAGHVRYLEEARKQGDILVVALNSDRSTRRLKGAGRPVNRLEDRLQVIAALEAADYVTWFGDSKPSDPGHKDTPYDLIVKLKPDVLVKGGDWTPERIVGGREVISWGGKVKSLHFVKGRSTTQVIRKISRSRG